MSSKKNLNELFGVEKEPTINPEERAYDTNIRRYNLSGMMCFKQANREYFIPVAKVIGVQIASGKVIVDTDTDQGIQLETWNGNPRMVKQIYL